jgi:phytoene synthase
MPQFSAAKEDIAACRTLLCSGSRSFFAASLLLPGRVRAPATALYAFCRVADDLIDLGDDPMAALDQLNERLDAAYEGRPWADPVDRAFAAAVTAYQIPRTLPAALIEGMAWDAQGRRYANFDELLDYAARVAGAVGVMMALVMGVSDASALARAADLGVAMQLTNIARDVGEDAAAGRLFLPLDWMDEAQVDVAAFLAAPACTRQVAGLIKRLLDEAAGFYARGMAGVPALPLDCRTGIAAAGRIYAAIGAEVAAAGYDSITRRARVRGGRKMLLALRAVTDSFGWNEADGPPAFANAFLVNAAAREAEPPAIVKLLTLFERLERSQREAAQA